MRCGFVFRTSPVLIVSLLLLFSATAPLATSGGGGDPEPDPKPENGRVQGVVYSEDFSTIEGASIGLWQDNETIYAATTDANGTYRIDDVKEGTYRMTVSAEGHKTHVIYIEVIPSTVQEIHFMLQSEPQPWVDGPNHWSGFISCWVASLDCSVIDPNHSTYHSEPVEEHLATATFALEWDAHALFGPEELHFVVEDHQGTLLGEAYGPSPLELRIDDGFEYADSLTFRVQPTITSLAYQQTFTLWWALHYVDPAPEGYSPLQ